MGRFSVGIVGSAQHSHEYLSWFELAGNTIDYINGLPAIIDKELLAGKELIGPNK